MYTCTYYLPDQLIYFLIFQQIYVILVVTLLGDFYFCVYAERGTH